MLLPTKGVSAERAIITVGADVLEQLQSPKSVTALWEQYTARERAGGNSDHITFDWFSLVLASLFAINLVEWTPSGHLRRAHVS
ncbi:ABC-three component system middle component 6 [Microbacterium phosphatis]|uniref:ABC-three component system middle component 6 n=1 Tax=Microbacterium phosphatis TaxID=3140248 RepID=UPI003BA171DD